MIKKLSELLRFSDWWNYLFPPVLGVVYFVIYFQKIQIEDTYSQLLLFFVSFVFTASFGFFLNDVSDIESDKLAGKKNISSDLSLTIRVLVLITLLLFSALPWFFLKNSFYAFFIYLFQLLLLVLYSIPPFRIKRHIIGCVLSDTLYSSFIPSLLAVFLFTQPQNLSSNFYPTISFLLLMFLRGFRNILIHQIADIEMDKKSGIKTFAIMYGYNNTKTIIKANVLIEYVGIVIFCVVVSLHIAYFWLILPAFVVYYLIKKYDKKNKFVFFDYQILNDFYEDFLVLFFLIVLSIFDEYYIVLLIIQIILFKNKLIWILLEKIIYGYFYRKLVLWLYYKMFCNKYVKKLMKHFKM